MELAMNQKRNLFVFFCLSMLLVGSGDSPKIMFRDMTTCLIELGDFLYLIPDDQENPEAVEDVAEGVYKNKLLRLKERYAKVKDRLQMLSQGDKDLKAEAKEAWAEASKEDKIAAVYVTGAVQRLDRIARKLQGGQAGDISKRFPFLAKCLKAQELLPPPSIGFLMPIPKPPQ
jgi:hypothetical protein